MRGCSGLCPGLLSGNINLLIFLLFRSLFSGASEPPSIHRCPLHEPPRDLPLHPPPEAPEKPRSKSGFGENPSPPPSSDPPRENPAIAASRPPNDPLTPGCSTTFGAPCPLSSSGGADLAFSSTGGPTSSIAPSSSAISNFPPTPSSSTGTAATATPVVGFNTTALRSTSCRRPSHPKAD